jgi:hypothetical protein
MTVVVVVDDDIPQVPLMFDSGLLAHSDNLVPKDHPMATEVANI